MVAIDPHAGNDRGPQEIEGYGAAAATDRVVFEANLRRAGVADRVRHVAAFSVDAHGAVEDPIDVLYVDGAHRYRPARADIRDWGARVGDGGTLLIHDAFSSVGVTLAIGRQLLAGRRFRYVGRSRSLVEYRADLSGRGRCRQRRPAAGAAAVVRPQPGVEGPPDARLGRACSATSAAPPRSGRTDAPKVRSDCRGER